MHTNLPNYLLVENRFEFLQMILELHKILLREILPFFIRDFLHYVQVDEELVDVFATERKSVGTTIGRGRERERNGSTGGLTHG
jgi:hypothetical protein